MTVQPFSAVTVETIGINSKELARALGVSYETVRTWGDNAPIPRFVIGTRRYYFRKDDVARYLGIPLHTMFPETEGILEDRL